MRTCVGCRSARTTDRLVRVARLGDGRLVFDRTAPGRGAWVCRDDTTGRPEDTCIEQALRRGGFARAFRAPVAQGSPTIVVDGGFASLPGRGAEHARIDERAAHGAVPEKGLT